MFFPMAPIKRNDSHGERRFDKTSHVDIDTVWIRARGVKRLDATDTTEGVLRNTGVERVRRDVIGPTNEMKRRLRHDQVKKATHRANRTVAVLDFKRFCGVHFERYRAAVTTTMVDHAFGASRR
jgi:hypothetical protein